MSSIEPVAGGHVTTPKGFLADGVSAGIKETAGKLDLGVLYSQEECAAAGVFTRNLVRAAAVIVSERRLKGGNGRGVVANSGCANAVTGDEGIADAEEMAREAAARAGIPAQAMLVCSTGLTGARLPMERVRRGIAALEPTAEGGPAFARAIMTTDTRPKEIAVAVRTDRGEYRVAGCAKGSGMIHPDMATMLAFVTTDAAVPVDLLQPLMAETAQETFNMLTIDGDTSCSDTLLAFANGAAGLPPIQPGTAEAETFRQALVEVCTHLTRELARDGEGAQRLIVVEVTGAASLEDARRVAKTVAGSLLVKTAVTGCDPNWGRILVAAGRAGAPLEERLVRLSLQEQLLLDRGRVVPFAEKDMRVKMDRPEVLMQIDLGRGQSGARAWGCDLTTEYVHINADYTT